MGHDGDTKARAWFRIIAGACMPCVVVDVKISKEAAEHGDIRERKHGRKHIFNGNFIDLAAWLPEQVVVILEVYLSTWSKRIMKPFF